MSVFIDDNYIKKASEDLARFNEVLIQSLNNENSFVPIVELMRDRPSWSPLKTSSETWKNFVDELNRYYEIQKEFGEMVDFIKTLNNFYQN